ADGQRGGRLRADRRRASAARVSGSRLGKNPRRQARGRRSDGAHARPGRKSATRRPVACGRGARLRAFDRRVQSHPAGRRGRRRSRPLDGRARASVAQAPGRRARAVARSPALGRTRARVAGDRGLAARDRARQRGGRPRALGARRRGPGARWSSTSPSPAFEKRSRAGPRGSPHRGRPPSPVGHRCARHAPREGQGSDPCQLLFERRPRPSPGAHPRHAVRRMKKKLKDRRVTIVVHTDGELASRQYRVPLWAFEAGKWGALVVGLLVVLFFAFAGPISRAAARVPGLEREVARLEEENARVQQLAAALNRAEVNYQELRSMLGVKPERDKVAPASTDVMRAPPVRGRPPSAPLRFLPGPSEPVHWPLDVLGFVTRGQVRPRDPAESHPGIDIAVPAGTPVRAAGGGMVEAAGTDPAYGLFVLLRHSGGYETMYGHASRVLVRDGDSIQAGQVIALSGNSGRSTAPHLHFEIRREGKSIDPLTVVKQEN